VSTPAPHRSAPGLSAPAAPEPVTTEAPAFTGPVLMHQDWRDLTYLHWAVDPALVAPLMPPGVRPDTLAGSTYVGLVPFRMVDAGLGRGPRVPWAGTFLETNVRLYSVDETGRRGVVFLGLDTSRAAVVLGARLGFGVPYRWAAMRHHRTVSPVSRDSPVGDEHRYTARLRWPGVSGSSRVAVRVGARREPTELDLFLSARWGLHTRWLGRTLYIPNRHPMWELHDAEVLDLEDDLVRSVGLGDLAGTPPVHVAFSPSVHTVFGPPRDARRPRRPSAGRVD
jgi:uncharacterized protein YqjF (DUF2071 family)